MIPIVKPYLPDLGKYQRFISEVYERRWLTNSGPLLKELEQRLADYLGVKHLMLVANGTLALQVAYRALGLEKGKAITTPFTFAATPGSLLWQNIQPRFSDICSKSLNLDPARIRLDELQQADALVGVHVFGNPCAVHAIQELARAHKLKVIYDAAHAFGSRINGESVLNFGDASTLSLHATKLFHCVEGGAIIFKDPAVLEKGRQLINFGFDQQNFPEFVGINAKMSEIHAAMGLALLDDVDNIIANRQATVDGYQQRLKDWVDFQQWHPQGQNNGAYAPILLHSEPQLVRVMQALSERNIQSRRYFYPCLSESPAYLHLTDTPVASDISRRVLCLPLYYGMTQAEQHLVCETIKSALSGA